ncbi:MAG: hypothetical protein HQL13_02180 [Candidatus Omnitrophica bacterium]|nr:hypothetical protein [Candidatus Omnitrophota bacterium]
MMPKIMLGVLLGVCFWQAQVWADNDVPLQMQGNRGCVYGAAPRRVCEQTQECQKPKQCPVRAASSLNESSTVRESHPLGDLFHAIKKLDEWIQRNMW